MKKQTLTYKVIVMICFTVLSACASLESVESQLYGYNKPITLSVFQVPISSVDTDLEIITPSGKRHRILADQWKPRRIGAGLAHFPSIKAYDWFDTKGNYTFRFSMGGNSKQIVQNLDGTELSVEFALRFDEENGILTGITLYRATRTVPSPKDVYFGPIRVNKVKGTATAPIHNQSKRDIHSTGTDATMCSIIQVQHNGKWFNYQTSDAWYSLDSVEHIKAGQHNTFDNPSYTTPRPLKPGKYRLINRYSHIPYLIRFKKQPVQRTHYQLSRQFTVK